MGALVQFPQDRGNLALAMTATSRRPPELESAVDSALASLAEAQQAIQRIGSVLARLTGGKA